MKGSDRSSLLRSIREFLPDDAARREQVLRFQSLTKPILEELANLGYSLENLGELRHQGRPWRSALPVLLRWLPEFDDPYVKDEIVRCLSVPWLGKTGTPLLIDEFRKAAPVNEMLAWTIGNALSIVDVAGFESQILDLCRNTSYGRTRQMLVLGLPRFRSAEAEQTAVELLTDESVKLHAIGALGKMKSRLALPKLEELLTDKKSVIRREARKAIARITR